jgi:hypothetical protein
VNAPLLPFMEDDRTTRERFEAFDRTNPHVYETFRRYARRLKAVRARGSARDIFGGMRWQALASTKGEPFKLNNYFSPYYARKLIAEDPSFASFFELRRAKADEGE